MFSSLPIFKNPITNVKNVKQLKYALMEHNYEFQIKAIGQIEGRHQDFFTNFSELKEFLVQLETCSNEQPDHSLDYIFVNTLKDTILLFVKTFDELIQLPPRAILGLLCKPKVTHKEFVKSPEQLDNLLRTLGPGNLCFAIANMELSWFKMIIGNLDDLILITTCLSMDDYFPFLKALDNEWIKSLIKNDSEQSRLEERLGLKGQLTFLQDEDSVKNFDRGSYYTPVYITEILPNANKIKLGI